jgi:hypothetical protein
MLMCVSVCMCVCVCVCARWTVRACVRVCVRAWVNFLSNRFRMYVPKVCKSNKNGCLVKSSRCDTLLGTCVR